MKKTQLRKAFVEELKTLDGQFTRMGIDTTKAIEEAVDALLNHDNEAAEKVIKNDEKINAYEVAIDKECFRLISLQSPIGDELRFIISIIKASADLERMGDHAVSIAKGALRIADEPRLENIESDLEIMTDTVIEMAELAVNAFVTRNDQQAKAAAEMDAKVDHYFDKLIPQVVSDMKKDNSLVVTGASYISMISNLERMGDYVTNLCERIIYLDEGKVVDLNG
ncbi:MULTISPECIES: phosphate signaling complex protein PhoU [Aerococcus]|uniref:Phosphate-specific transport system accessory protein PhoU n=1 Tax=Aerococcus urinae TaxID=1376 RepID=A0A0X8FE30_9LACT|nr:MULTISPECIES: phosphate signaling complex protein PhoU [Aerococcus]AEA01595.1 phosphate transport system regulatory protein PhoU [Aerococcus sp. Group 1]AMB95643.1 hypothetical protein AWM73_03605 [Aerococcus urinae]KAA9232394.1 phosphate signaling complex protein PhoU [Aerococcus mictus]KAA9297190.1 phosphate signaling complex protein PhoU [Aerococcus tenax]MBU5609945.1 phosphate signaling complex protein PhoU [Aerococcus urinae]